LPPTDSLFFLFNNSVPSLRALLQSPRHASASVLALSPSHLWLNSRSWRRTASSAAALHFKFRFELLHPTDGHVTKSRSPSPAPKSATSTTTTTTMQSLSPFSVATSSEGDHITIPDANRSKRRPSYLLQRLLGRHNSKDRDSKEKQVGSTPTSSAASSIHAISEGESPDSVCVLLRDVISLMLSVFADYHSLSCCCSFYFLFLAAARAAKVCSSATQDHPAHRELLNRGFEAVHFWCRVWQAVPLARRRLHLGRNLYATLGVHVLSGERDDAGVYRVFSVRPQNVLVWDISLFSLLFHRGQVSAGDTRWLWCGHALPEWQWEFGSRHACFCSSACSFRGSCAVGSDDAEANDPSVTGSASSGSTAIAY